MIRFVVRGSRVFLQYQAEDERNGWVWHQLQTRGVVRLVRVFEFTRGDLVNAPAKDDQEDFEYSFRFASRVNGYFRIEGRIFGIQNPVLIADSGLNLDRKVFVAERGISIFAKIAELVSSDQEIVIGGDKARAIPISEFETLLRKFPNTTELNRYAAARVSTVIGDYLAPLQDARERYEVYLNRKRSLLDDQPLRQPELLKTELEKYTLMRDDIAGWLEEADVRSEKDWQRLILTFLLLIFPKYLAVLESVSIEDSYSSPSGKKRKRIIDLALIDVNGTIDVIEIKKPFENALLRRTKYRDNSVPAKELAGSIMQAEKYLFHLSKWGSVGEKKLTERHSSQLPKHMQIRITNPKALIILGRDCRRDGTRALDEAQTLDFEIIKRKYANMIDIMTYDDLLRRLDNIIASLRKRKREEISGPPARQGRR